jgi:hypothetical protein
MRGEVCLPCGVGMGIALLPVARRPHHWLCPPIFPPNKNSAWSVDHGERIIDPALPGEFAWRWPFVLSFWLGRLQGRAFALSGDQNSSVVEMQHVRMGLSLIAFGVGTRLYAQ